MHWRILAATIAGMLLGAILLALIGWQSEQTRLGCVSGVVVGGLVGYLTITNRMSRVTVGGMLGASISAIMGPGTDMPGLLAAPFGAIIGMIAGWFGWPWVLGLIAVPVGLVVGQMSVIIFSRNWPASGLSPGQCQLLGMLTFAIVAVVAGYWISLKGAHYCRQEKPDPNKQAKPPQLSITQSKRVRPDV